VRQDAFSDIQKYKDDTAAATAVKDECVALLGE
jgi:hypothetical protein